MSDDINKMDFKQLRNEVQLLRDELALFKRKWEDAICNLDTDNFSSRFVKEKNDMRTAIEVTAEGIKTKVSKEDFQSSIEQTAESISSIISEFVDVSQAVEVDSPDAFIDTGKIYVIREKDSDGNVLTETFYHYNTISEDWKQISADGIIYSLFEQKEDGFYLKGDVKVEGSCILTDSLVFDSSDNPLQVEYSADGKSNWHSTFVSGSDEFMRLKIGANWSDAMKVVGTDGYDGNDVSPWTIFDILTDEGRHQGLFSAFTTDGEHLYINAEFLATRIAYVDDTLYIGDEDSYGSKSIKFNRHATISSYDYTNFGEDGLFISSNGFGIDNTPDRIYFTAPGGASFINDKITLADYVSQYGSGGSGGPVVAVFGPID